MCIKSVFYSLFAYFMLKIHTAIHVKGRNKAYFTILITKHTKRLVKLHIHDVKLKA